MTLSYFLTAISTYPDHDHDHHHQHDHHNRDQVTFLEFRLGRFLSPHVAGCPDGGMLIQEGRGQVGHGLGGHDGEDNHDHCPADEDNHDNCHDGDDDHDHDRDYDLEEESAGKGAGHDGDGHDGH